MLDKALLNGTSFRCDCKRIFGGGGALRDLGKETDELSLYLEGALCVRAKLRSQDLGQAREQIFADVDQNYGLELGNGGQ